MNNVYDVIVTGAGNGALPAILIEAFCGMWYTVYDILSPEHILSSPRKES